MLGPTLLSHFSEDLERLWLCSMVEPAYSESRHGQRQLSRLLLSATLQHAAPAAPVLTALGLLPPEMLASRAAFQRIDVLHRIIDTLAAQLGSGQDAKEPLER